MSKFHLHVMHPRLGKISNNLEKHGEEDIPGFTVPVSCELDTEDLDTLLGAGFAARVFTKAGEPAPGFALCAPLNHRWTWAKIHAELIGEEGGPCTLEFEDCQVKALTLEFGSGWMTQCTFQLYLHPGFGDANLALQRLQRQELGELVLSGGERKLKPAESQAQLPLGATAEDAASEATAAGLVRSDAA